MFDNYIEFKDTDYTKLRRDLLRTKGSDKQRLFLAAVRERTSFCRYLRDSLEETGAKRVPLVALPLTDNEYKAPPPDTEERLYRAWSALTPRVACRTTFWAHLTCRHVEAGRIEPVYLASNGNPSACGAERIDRVLSGTGEKASKPIDDSVRTVLRRLGGIPEARGNRTVYVDCPFARAWWREYLVRQIAGDDESLARDIRRVFRVSQFYWEKIVDRIVSRNSTFGSMEVRNALVLRLARVLRDPESRMRTVKNLEQVCREVSAQQGIRELSVLSEAELGEVLDPILQPA